MNLALPNQSLLYTPRCTRSRYVALAVLLGPLGVHNFAAGYRFRALIQLGLSVASMGLLSPVTAVWALIEALVVKADGDGVSFENHATRPREISAAEHRSPAEPESHRRAA